MSERGLLKEWQKRLSMQDWRIGLETNCDPGDMELIDSSGCVRWQESTKTAYIQIIDPKFYGERVVPFDFEQTLVHEMLHLKMCLLCPLEGGLRERVAHQLIDELARALVDAKRVVPQDV